LVSTSYHVTTAQSRGYRSAMFGLHQSLAVLRMAGTACDIADYLITGTIRAFQVSWRFMYFL
jgi:hypothetical protein